MAKNSTRARGQIIPKGPDRWLVRVFLGTDTLGKRKYASKSLKGTRKDAEAALDKLLVGAAENTVAVKTPVTVKQHIEAWLNGRVDIAPKTLMDYRNRMESDVYPILGSKPLANLTHQHIAGFIKNLSVTRGLSPRTVRYSYTVFNAALEDAVNHKLIPANPARHSKLPKKAHAEPPALTPEQMHLLLESTAADIQRNALWHILLTAGLRPQEVLALRWPDLRVTLTPEGTTLGYLTIVRALKKVGTAQWVVGEVKTKKGRRTIPIPAETVAALQKHRAKQSAEILRAGAQYARNEFIFASRKHSPGKHLDPQLIGRWWKKALVAAGIPPVRLYAARHSFVTAGLAGKVHPKVMSEMAGHGNIQTTLDTYSHVINGMQESASQTIGSLIFNSVQKVG